MYIIIENIGSTIAKDIKITSNKPLKNSHGETFEDFKEIKSLPPKYDIKSYFDETYRYKEKNNDKFPDFEFTVEFTTIYNKRIKREFDSNLGFLNSVGFMGDEMKSVEMSLYDINKNMSKIYTQGIEIKNNDR